MNLKFWQKTSTPKDETIIQVDRTDTLPSGASSISQHTSIYVKAATSEKAHQLFEELKQKAEAE